MERYYFRACYLSIVIILVLNLTVRIYSAEYSTVFYNRKVFSLPTLCLI